MSSEERKKIVDMYIKSQTKIDLTGGKTLSDYPEVYQEWLEEKDEDKYWKEEHDKFIRKRAV